MVEAGHTMGIRLSIEITTPIDDDDKQMMAGVAAMTFAIANSEQMQAQDEAEQEESGEPEPCGSVSQEVGGICVREAGHSGRHKHRPAAEVYPDLLGRKQSLN